MLEADTQQRLVAVACRRPEHLNLFVAGATRKLFGTCDGDADNPASLFLIGFFGAFGGLSE